MRQCQGCAHLKSCEAADIPIQNLRKFMFLTVSIHPREATLEIMRTIYGSVLAQYNTFPERVYDTLSGNAPSCPYAIAMQKRVCENDSI